MGYLDDLSRIDAALDAALVVLGGFISGDIEARRKSGGSPVTKADEAVDAEMRRILPLPGEGWLSEESVDSPERLGRKRVWVVDPIDGTREFVRGVPEWCVSIALIEDGRPVAGGIHNPATGERITGSVDTGVEYKGPQVVSGKRGLAGARVGASRSEIGRGEWDRFCDDGFEIVPMGSVAYKLALVGAGVLDATWTLVPKHEWDLAAGVALIESAGGWVTLKDGTLPQWNKADPVVSGFIATTAALRADVERLLLS